MKRINLIRLGGFAAMVGGVLYALERYWSSLDAVPAEKQNVPTVGAAPVYAGNGFAAKISALAVYPRHRLDVSVRDLLFGLTACLWASRRRRLAAEVARTFPPSEDALVCLSVRSGFDLLLGALAEPPGGEVLVSAVTHPDMVRIIEGHGLGAVPVDLDTATLEPRIKLLQRALSPRTRAILVAHLFGSRFDLDPIAAFARKHRLLLVEDCAQTFRGTWDPGDSLADVSMFSFGTLKTASAVGGAILRIRNSGLLEKMRWGQERWPVQSRRHYAGRLLRALYLILLSRPVPYGLLAHACGLLGRDLDDLVNGAVRTFPTSGSATEELFRSIRRQPSAPLLALLTRRLRTFDDIRLARRTAAGERVARRLPSVVCHPGGLAPMRTHWLFPVVVPDPGVLVSALNRRGFDASRATSNIAPVPTPRNLSELAPEEARRMMSRLVFLPVYPDLPDETLDRLVSAVEDAIGLYPEDGV
ncbi:MAG TPA: DegT/DnrJ/EryC1/StrS family aminotransferase [Rubrobacteraceae bacterium]|nr:DegT/DnrJ/EryC1/StrS family aminotransferase [Rubrobacteraceae bacterium]